MLVDITQWTLKITSRLKWISTKIEESNNDIQNELTLIYKCDKVHTLCSLFAHIRHNVLA